MNKFSIIIPTMWFSNKLDCLIEELIKSELVSEIIIIDNNKSSNNKTKIVNEKLIILPQEENIFVNPAWNLGVNISKNENIILSNDDLCISNINKVLLSILNTNFDFIGLDYQNINKDNEVIITKTSGGMTKGFGCFMFIKKNKYIQIPENIKIWFGDAILHNSIENKGKLSCNNCNIELSKTIKSISNSLETIKQDELNYNLWKLT
jgi:hypothetical protein